jgi:hypothetical protein
LVSRPTIETVPSSLKVNINYNLFHKDHHWDIEQDLPKVLAEKSGRVDTKKQE